MICWDCHWGWPKVVFDIYLKALKALNGQDSPLDYGPGHVVWADENFELAEVCLEGFEQPKYLATYDNYTKEELEIARQALVELSKLPLGVRCVEPEDYDGYHPEKYPPSSEIEMINKAQMFEKTEEAAR